jgi:general secretion pathway protein A
MEDRVIRPYNRTVQPPSAPADLGQPLYEVFYGLREQPFALTTDPRFLYLSASHRQAFDDLLTGLRRREGLMLLTGETGTGKTTLCRAVIDALGHRTFSALILNPYMSDAEVLRVILRDFGLVSRDEIRKGAFAHADTPQLLDTLEGFLRSLISLNSYAVVLIDEAQNLPPKVIDQIRVLGSFEQDGQRLLQIVLVGQPSLVTMLESEPMRATNDRISRRIALTPLESTEVDGYIRHRLAIAGSKDGVTFQPEAVRLVGELSHGLPRRVNLLCDRTLEEGRVAGTTTLKTDHVRRAAKALAGNARPAPPPEASEPAGSATAEAATDASLMFGVKPDAPVRRGRRVIGAMALLVVLLAGAAGYSAWQLVGRNLSMPTLPIAPRFKIPTIELPPMPTDDELMGKGDAP